MCEYRYAWLLQARLVSLFASYELDCSVEAIQERLQQLVQVLPDLGELLQTAVTSSQAHALPSLRQPLSGVKHIIHVIDCQQLEFELCSAVSVQKEGYT